MFGNSDKIIKDIVDKPQQMYSYSRPIENLLQTSILISENKEMELKLKNQDKFLSDAKSKFLKICQDHMKSGACSALCGGIGYLDCFIKHLKLIIKTNNLLIDKKKETLPVLTTPVLKDEYKDLVETIKNNTSPDIFIQIMNKMNEKCGEYLYTKIDTIDWDNVPAEAPFEIHYLKTGDKFLDYYSGKFDEITIWFRTRAIPNNKNEYSFTLLNY